MTTRFTAAFQELDQLVRDTGTPELVHALQPSFERLTAGNDTAVLRGQVLVYGPDPAANAAVLQALLPGGHEAALEVDGRTLLLTGATWDRARPDTDRYPGPAAAVLVFLPGSEALDGLAQHVDMWCKKIPVVLLLGDTASRVLLEKTLETWSAGCLALRWLDRPADDTPPDLAVALSAVLPSGKMALLDDAVFGHALDDLKETFQLMAANEERQLKARRQLNQQQLTRLKLRSGQQTLDLVGAIKNSLQQQLGLFEKSLTARVEQTFKRQTGDYWRVVDPWLAGIDRLDEEKKLRTVLFSLPPEKIQGFWTLNRDFFSRFGTTDLKLYHDVLELAVAELHETLEKNGVAPLSIHPRYATQEQLDALIQGLLSVDKPYRGEQMRRGGYEYFMAVRKYQMLLMMLFSSLGLSFIKKTQTFMLPLTFFLLAIGIVNVVRSVRQERAESRERELERAREQLTTEARRIGTEFGRAWPRQLIEALREQFDRLLMQVEGHLRQSAQKQAGDVELERTKLQRILAGLETQERRLENVRRGISNWERTFSRLMGDLYAAYRRPA